MDRTSLRMLVPATSVQLFAKQRRQRQLRDGRLRHGADEADLRLRQVVSATADYSGQHRRTDRGRGDLRLKALLFQVALIRVEFQSYVWYKTKTLSHRRLWSTYLSGSIFGVNFTRQFEKYDALRKGCCLLRQPVKLKCCNDILSHALTFAPVVRF